MVAEQAGATNQRPFSGLPSNAAQHAPLSNRGQHSQSIEPPREMRAAVSQSPTKA
jgi:hypothetical protein